MSLQQQLQLQQQQHRKTLFCMVGLPARGKSFLCAKIVTFFNWSGISARIFNAGSRRRDSEGAETSGRATFFSSDDSSAVSKRDTIAMATLAEAIHFLEKEEGFVAVFDATNTTKLRRAMVRDFLLLTSKGEEKINLVFIESICNDETVLRNNRLQKVSNSPDFRGMTKENALHELTLRETEYDKVYEPLEDGEGFPYIKIIDLACKVICFQIWGAIPMKTTQLLMSCHVGQRPVYLVRAGACNGVDDLSRGKWIVNRRGCSADIPGAAGPYATTKSSVAEACTGTNSTSSENEGDITPKSGGGAHILDLSVTIPSATTSAAKLSEAGQKFARRFATYIHQQGRGSTLSTFSSTMPRAVETASALGGLDSAGLIFHQQWSALNIQDTGICHGLSIQYIKDNMSAEYHKWKADPAKYRFPGGESIFDMNKRLAEVIMEIEHRREPVVVVSHLSTLQSLVAYFTAKDPSSIPFIEIQQHSLVVLTPSIYGWKMEVVAENDLPKDI